MLLTGNEGREKREGNSGKGTFIIGNIYKLCTTLDLSMHEALIRCMHEKVNDYAGELMKLFFK